MVENNYKEYEDFIKWIKSEMYKMRLRHKDLAGNICSRPLISMVLAGKAKPDHKFLLAASEALRVPLDLIYEKAGIKESHLDDSMLMATITRELSKLSPAKRKEAERYIRFLRQEDDRETDEDDLLEKMEQLTDEERLNIIRAADSISAARDESIQDDNLPNNRHYLQVAQSRLC